MKYIIAIILFISINIVTNLFAQIPPGYNALGKFQIDHSDLSCFAQSDYPTVNNLVDDLLIQYLGYAFCITNCPYQPMPSCTAILLDQDDVLDDSDDQWCFTSDPEFQWICGPAPSPTDPVPPTSTQGDNMDSAAGDLQHPTINYWTSQKITTGIFPNPSKGKVQLLIDHQLGNLPELLIITDWSGKKIQMLPLILEPHIINKINLNLSDQPVGFYLATLYYKDGVMVSEKIMIQQ